MPDRITTILLPVLSLLPARRPCRRGARRPERGQATAEYALVLLGAAAVALVLVTWAGGGRVSQFFNTVFDHLTALAR